jgi:hypothetical protein
MGARRETTVPERVVVPRRPGDLSPRRRLRLRTTDGGVEDLILTADELRRLRQTIADVRENRRFLIVSRLSRGHAFYYNVTDHGYAMNRPDHATLFLKRDQAQAVAALLSPGVRVVRYRTRVRNGVRVPVVPRTRRRRAPR